MTGVHASSKLRYSASAVLLHMFVAMCLVTDPLVTADPLPKDSVEQMGVHAGALYETAQRGGGYDYEDETALEDDGEADDDDDDDDYKYRKGPVAGTAARLKNLNTFSLRAKGPKSGGSGAIPNNNNDNNNNNNNNNNVAAADGMLPDVANASIARDLHDDSESESESESVMEPGEIGARKGRAGSQGNKPHNRHSNDGGIDDVAALVWSYVKDPLWFLWDEFAEALRIYLICCGIKQAYLRWPSPQCLQKAGTSRFSLSYAIGHVINCPRTHRSLPFLVPLFWLRYDTWWELVVSPRNILFVYLACLEATKAAEVTLTLTTHLFHKASENSYSAHHQVRDFVHTELVEAIRTDIILQAICLFLTNAVLLLWRWSEGIVTGRTQFEPPFHIGSTEILGQF